MTVEGPCPLAKVGLGPEFVGLGPIDVPDGIGRTERVAYHHLDAALRTRDTYRPDFMVAGRFFDLGSTVRTV